MDINQYRLRSTGLSGRIIMFADFLKSRGFKVFQSSVHDSLISLAAIDYFHRPDFMAALRANLASGDIEWKQFEDLFYEFWDPLLIPELDQSCDACDRNPDETQGSEPRPRNVDMSPLEGPENEQTREQERSAAFAYSPLPGAGKKELGGFERTDVQIAHLALKRIAEPFRLQKYRHVRPSRRKGRLYFPRILKESLRTGGIPLKLYYREKKRRLKRLVIIADVSGSMDRYTCLLMPFILGIKGIGSRAEAFVFSTSLTAVTFFIRHFSVEEALKKMALEVPDWSGGTNIGESLRQFNREHGHRLLNNRTVVVILSDGWDLWPEILRRELSLLSSKVHRVIWLNPELGRPDCHTFAQGMTAALPYIDYFMPADDLESLKRVGHLLTQVMIH
ncbi:MAG: VWA domain-containing protein [Deltaproteobacteria bacterium]|nr:VWA domain-containing protein [Deltaproteobacteria bacterium]